MKDCPQEVLDTTDCFVQERKSFISELKNSIKMCKLDDIPDDSMDYERISFLKEEDLGLDSVYKNLFEEDTDDF